MYGTAFDWPTPPYSNFMHHDDNAEPETCLIYLRNNKKLLGRLVRIIPEETDILFLPARGKTNEIIPLN